MSVQLETNPPTVSASVATSLTSIGATLNGNVTSDGGATITERGFVYNTSPGVTISDNKTVVAGTTGAFTLDLTGLTTGTTYYFRAYAINAAGTTLSTEELSFTPGQSASPTLSAAGVATVDAPFEITFTDDSAWRSAITGIEIGGVPLTAGWTVSEGKITFTPASSVPTSALQSAGSKAIVVKATNFIDASVSQSLGAGQAAKLAISTQPTAPAFNGGPLAVQPVVAIQDQYGNATASTASVTAAVGAGTWNLGGTVTVAAVNGTATFSGLTATSAAAVTGATVTFSSGSLTAVTSSGFNIPAFAEIVISQIYAHGGNQFAAYNRDYVELYNRGASDRSLAGWSIQYASSTTWSVQSLSNSTIRAGGYLLIGLDSGTNGIALPKVDVSGTINLSGTAGKIALSSSTNSFTGTNSPIGNAALVDFVGYGSTDASEGMSPASPPTLTNAIFRKANGATDSNNNGADFELLTASPRNSIFGTSIGSITLNPSPISGLLTPVNAPSPATNYVVTGTNLGTTNLVITPSSALVEISTNAVNGFSADPITLPPTPEGTISHTIYLRLAATNTATNVTATVTHVSGTASNDLTVSGQIYGLASYHALATGDFFDDFDDITNRTAPTSGSWQGLLASGSTGIPTAGSVSAATLNFVSSASSGVQRGTGSLVLLAAGSTPENSTSSAIDLQLNFAGRKAGTLSFDAATVFNGATNSDRPATLRLYASTNGTTWSDLSGIGAPFVATNNVEGASLVILALPSEFDNASQARIRFYAHNAGLGTTGSRPKISIDNVSVSSTELPPANSAPTNIILSATTIAENNAAGAVVGTLSTEDPDSGDTFTYSLYSGLGPTDNSAFDIVGNELKIKGVADFETKASYTVRVRSTDSASNTTEKVFTITVTDVNENVSFAGWRGTNPASAELLTQYAFGALSPGSAVSRSNLPTGGVSGSNLTLTYFVRAEATNTNLVTPQWHTNLSESNSWAAVASNNISDLATNNTADGVQVIQRQASVPVEGSRKFLRLKIAE